MVRTADLAAILAPTGSSMFTTAAPRPGVSNSRAFASA
jgi:hypothetical protein